ncbi:MAG TPA: tRNA (adenosine(37)-N6)-threonylcarbamoyltransferase complex ATPase subunit type 1 TsaE [Rhizomicrobium sp.]|nr:tRNA (adenosine(37)-N6)-threonylcarbamoyltransferase complex ATPase subunit type 1 TsaE [Rhizomicrobium sp.]
MQHLRAEIDLPDPAATEALGARIARVLATGDAVALAGDLGAGKTALARSILRALGVAEDVPSPTFTLVQVYETPGLTVSHFDLYRVGRESELDELGFDDALASGAVLVEWPERAPDRIPGDALHVHLSDAGASARRAVLAGCGRWTPLFAAEGAHG